MLGKLIRIASLFKRYHAHAISLIVNPLLGKDIWILLHGRKVWLNFDPATYYHLNHSIDKLEKLVENIPSGLTGIVIDGGANHGIFSLLTSQKFPNSKVYAFEPYDKVLPVLKKNTIGTNIIIVEKALSNTDGEIAFFTADASDQVGSVIRDNVEELTPQGSPILEAKVQAISLKSFVNSEKINRIAVLKLDVQGAEYAILENADDVLAITDCLVLEVVLIEPSTLQLLEKARKFFPYHKVLNPLPYGADIIFTKQPLDK